MTSTFGMRANFLNKLKFLTRSELSYRQVPTFGRDTIRKFSTNTSELKKLAARDFEDMLQVSVPLVGLSLYTNKHKNQCSIAVFDGLLPEPHNSIVMRLLFVCSHWHGLAKLRLHSDITVAILDEVTTALGEAFREFQLKVCPAFATRELPREARARERRAQSKSTKSTTGIAESQKLTTATKLKPFNLDNFKHHSLGDYAQTIRDFGTTDSFSSQIVSTFLYLSLFRNTS